MVEETKKGLTNKQCRTYITNLKPFENKNKTLFGRWVDANTYVVYSYGSHFPIYVWVRQTNRWYANEDRYSVTTTRHQSYARPYSLTDTPPTPVSTSFLKSLAIQGFAATAAARVVYGEVL
jgi:hypothetical protein